ncbi:MAG: hypothetical protein LBI69_02020 [Puniceicoccales bacterium]|nr:hypothetical protein [Puniceicoccales bacterium]
MVPIGDATVPRDEGAIANSSALPGNPPYSLIVITLSTLGVVAFSAGACMLWGNLPAVIFCIIAAVVCIAIDICLISQALKQLDNSKSAEKQESELFDENQNHASKNSNLRSQPHFITATPQEERQKNGRYIQHFGKNQNHASKNSNLRSQPHSIPTTPQEERKKNGRCIQHFDENQNHASKNSNLHSQFQATNLASIIAKGKQPKKGKYVQRPRENQNHDFSVINPINPQVDRGLQKLNTQNNQENRKIIEYVYGSDDATIQQDKTLNGFGEKIDELVSTFQNVNDQKSYSEFKNLLSSTKKHISNMGMHGNKLTMIYENRLLALLCNAELQFAIMDNLCKNHGSFELNLKENSIVDKNISCIANGLPLAKLIKLIRAATVDMEGDSETTHSYESVCKAINTFKENYKNLKYPMRIFVQNFEVVIPSSNFINTSVISLLDEISKAFNNRDFKSIKISLTQILKSISLSSIIDYSICCAKIMDIQHICTDDISKYSIASNLILLATFFNNVRNIICWNTDHPNQNQDSNTAIMAVINEKTNSITSMLNLFEPPSEEGKIDITTTEGGRSIFEIFTDFCATDINSNNGDLPNSINSILHYINQSMNLSNNILDELASRKNSNAGGDISQI